MKKFFSVLMCVIVLTVSVLCVGCKQALQNFDNKEVREKTDAMLNALIEDDYDTAYSLVSHLTTKEEFSEVYGQMRGLLDGTDDYELELLSIYTNKSIKNGVKKSTVSADYELISENDRIVVSVILEDQVGLVRFYLTPYESTDYYITGTIENIKEANAVQWAFLLLNVIIIGFTVFAIVDCCRHKIRKKILWLIILILGIVTVGITISSGGLRFNFNLGWFMAYSALIRYGSGTLMLRLMLPVGTIAYFMSRHSLLNPKAPTYDYGDLYPDMPSDQK